MLSDMHGHGSVMLRSAPTKPFFNPFGLDESIYSDQIKRRPRRFQASTSGASVQQYGQDHACTHPVGLQPLLQFRHQFFTVPRPAVANAAVIVNFCRLFFLSEVQRPKGLVTRSFVLVRCSAVRASGPVVNNGVYPRATLASGLQDRIGGESLATDKATKPSFRDEVNYRMDEVWNRLQSQIYLGQSFSLWSLLLGPGLRFRLSLRLTRRGRVGMRLHGEKVRAFGLRLEADQMA